MFTDLSRQIAHNPASAESIFIITRRNVDDQSGQVTFQVFVNGGMLSCGEGQREFDNLPQALALSAEEARKFILGL